MIYFITFKTYLDLTPILLIYFIFYYLKIIISFLGNPILGLCCFLNMWKNMNYDCKLMACILLCIVIMLV